MSLNGVFADDPSLDADELNDLFSMAYEELRRLARAVHRSSPNATLNPTALVNEAYVKLRASNRLRFVSHMHFKRVAARAMRQVLIEAARKKQALKRGGGQALVTFDEQMGHVEARSAELLHLNDALDTLAARHPRQAALVEYRFFGGFTVAETADLLGVSEATALRDWRAARAWLIVHLRP